MYEFLQGNISVASIYAGSNCMQLGGPEILTKVNHLLRLLTLCMLFSKKPFPVFLESSGYSQEDVLLQKPKAAVCYLHKHNHSDLTLNDCPAKHRMGTPA